MALNPGSAQLVPFPVTVFAALTHTAGGLAAVAAWAPAGARPPASRATAAAPKRTVILRINPSFTSLPTFPKKLHLTLLRFANSRTLNQCRYPISKLLREIGPDARFLGSEGRPLTYGWTGARYGGTCASGRSPSTSPRCARAGTTGCCLPGGACP